MNRLAKWGLRLGIGGVVTVTGAIGVVSCGSYETASYSVVQQDGAYEVRQYDEMMMVSAPMQSVDKRGENDSFRKLFKFISKGNKDQQSISMTTPVFEKVDQGVGKMYFVMPQKMLKDGVPAPTDPSLEIITQAGANYAVYRYSGSSNFERRTEAKGILMEWLKKSKLKSTGEAIYAGYNPPFTPGPFRRNEVLIEVE